MHLFYLHRLSCGANDVVGNALATLLPTPLCKPPSEPQVSKKAADAALEGMEGCEGAVSVAIAGLSELAGLMKNASLPGRIQVIEFRSVSRYDMFLMSVLP